MYHTHSNCTYQMCTCSVDSIKLYLTNVSVYIMSVIHKLKTREYICNNANKHIVTNTCIIMNAV